MADDFFLTILLLKSVDHENHGLPFLYGHVIELSAKAAIYKLNPSAKPGSMSHNIKHMHNLIGQHVKDFSFLIPRESSFAEYKKVWINDDTQNRNIKLPPPDMLWEWELCYFIDNIVDLKYGFTRQLKQISSLMLYSTQINYRFLELFTACRKVYADEQLNLEIKRRALSMFGSASGTSEKLDAMLGIGG